MAAAVIDATDIGSYAIEYGLNGWPVFLCNGKVPAIPNPHPKRTWERDHCKGECGLQGHGVLDATIDVATIADWWGGDYAGCNIGGRVPESMFMLIQEAGYEGVTPSAAEAADPGFGRASPSAEAISLRTTRPLPSGQGVSGSSRVLSGSATRRRNWSRALLSSFHGTRAKIPITESNAEHLFPSSSPPAGV